jgi:hypothetical protein
MKATSSPRSNHSAAGWLRALAALGLLSAAWSAADAVNLPERVPFERYRLLAQRSFFSAPTFPTSLRLGGRLVPVEDLYLADISWSPDGVKITLRSSSDPTFSMTIKQNSPKLAPPKQWKEDISL